MAERPVTTPTINSSGSSTASRVGKTMSGDTLTASALRPESSDLSEPLADIARHSQAGEIVAQHVRLNGNPSLAAAPARATVFRTAESVSGP